MDVLELTNGTVTVNLINTSADGGLHLAGAGWAPRVAAPLNSDLGNRGSVADVDEQITVEAHGANGLAELRRVAQLLSDARRWWRDPSNPGPVRLRMRPENSIQAPGVVYESLVIGPAGDSPLGLPDDFLDLLAIRELGQVTINLRRRGPWIPPDASTAWELPDFTAYSPRLVTLSATDPGGFYHTPSPTAIGLGAQNTATYPAVSTSGPQHQPVGVILTGASTNDFFVVLSLSIPSGQRTPAASWANVANATAFGGQATRFTWSAANPRGSLAVELAATAGIFDIYVTARIGNSSNLANVVPWSVRARTPDGTPDASVGNWVSIDRDQDTLNNDPAQHANARVVHLGQFERIASPTTFLIEVEPDGTATTQDWIEFNVICSHRITGINSRALAIDRAAPNLGIDVRNRSINIRPNALTSPTPTVRVDASATPLTNAPVAGVPYRGDAYFETTINQLAVLLLATMARGAANTPTLFYPNTFYRLRVERQPAYLIPE